MIDFEEFVFFVRPSFNFILSAQTESSLRMNKKYVVSLVKLKIYTYTYWYRELGKKYFES